MSPNTKPIGRGTVNRTANLPEPLDRQIGRLAFESDLSISAYLRHLAKEAAEQGRVITGHLQDARQTALHLTVIVLVGLGFGCTIAKSIVGENEPRRCARRTARRRDEAQFIDLRDLEGRAA